MTHRLDLELALVLTTESLSLGVLGLHSVQESHVGVTRDFAPPVHALSGYA
jgi:hypothetical protein